MRSKSLQMEGRRHPKAPRFQVDPGLQPVASKARGESLPWASERNERVERGISHVLKLSIAQNGAAKSAPALCSRHLLGENLHQTELVGLPETLLNAELPARPQRSRQ
jgi:hypothetical protein